MLNGPLASAQSAYFPPEDNNQWERVSPESLGWDTSKLNELLFWLGNSETVAFVILKDGKLVVEQYYGLFGREREWYWASAGKTVTAALIGALEKQGLLDISQPVSHYLGAGWTSLTPTQEERITPWHQLTMTTGINYEVEDEHCTLPQCLQFKHNPGEQWFYHNAPYTLLTHVAEAAADTNLNTVVNNVFGSVPGLQLRYVDGLLSPFNRVVVSRALDMARFGLLISRESTWEGQEPLLNSAFADQMLKPSQPLNPSYGYLWWLNGQESFIPPGFSISVQRDLIPAAPPDMVSALGMNSQVLSIVPSMGLIIVRMGRDPGSLFGFANQKWERLAEVIGTSTSVETTTETPGSTYLGQNYPNPFNPSTQITYYLNNPSTVRLDVYDLTGRHITSLVNGHKHAGIHHQRFHATDLASGLYVYRLQTPEGVHSRLMLLVR
jgi:CubicO group peptidase (beta-lactamase class C family)